MGGGVVVVVALNVVVFFVVVLLLLLSIDPPNHWDGLKIPAGMLSVKDGKRIVAMMDLERMDIASSTVTPSPRILQASSKTVVLFQM